MGILFLTEMNMQQYIVLIKKGIKYVDGFFVKGIARKPQVAGPVFSSLFPLFTF